MTCMVRFPGNHVLQTMYCWRGRLVEKGVRFVQLFDWGWDSHGSDASLAIDIGFINKCRQVDKSITALILDLKQRGMLEETLVVWGGEFGRTPMMENREGKKMPFKGRDHHTEAFTIWMAGAGIKKGFSVMEKQMKSDIARSAGKLSHSISRPPFLTSLGFDHEKFTYQFQGRPFRLTDTRGKVIEDILV